MKCELCHQANAETVFYRTTESGAREELYVCHACAKREQVFNQERGIQVTAMDTEGFVPGMPTQNPQSLEDLKAMGIPPKELFGKLGEMFDEMSKTFPVEDELPDDLRCPTCGTTFNDLRGGGLMGCADCYTAFEKGLSPLLDDLHLCTHHISDPTMARQRKIAELNRLLMDAIQHEDYQAAKELKTQLAKLLAEEITDEEGE